MLMLMLMLILMISLAIWVSWWGYEWPHNQVSCHFTLFKRLLLLYFASESELVPHLLSHWLLKRFRFLKLPFLQDVAHVMCAQFKTSRLGNLMMLMLHYEFGWQSSRCEWKPIWWHPLDLSRWWIIILLCRWRLHGRLCWLLLRILILILISIGHYSIDLTPQFAIWVTISQVKQKCFLKICSRSSITIKTSATCCQLLNCCRVMTIVISAGVLLLRIRRKYLRQFVLRRWLVLLTTVVCLDSFWR